MMKKIKEFFYAVKNDTKAFMITMVSWALFLVVIFICFYLLRFVLRLAFC